MKTLLIFPPQWMPVSPYFALPTLLGQFTGTELEANALDLNVDFYNQILTSEYVQMSLDLAKKLLPMLKDNIRSYYNKENNYTFEQKIEIAKASIINNTLQKYDKDFNQVITLIEQSVEIMKSKKHYYNPKLFLPAINTIKIALEICSMPYAPTRIDFISYSNPFLNLDYDTIKYFVFDDTTNIFRKYLESQVEKIKSYNAENIGISINSSNQIVAGLTLSNILMKETKAHISIGGNHFGRVKEALFDHPEFFELFCHSLQVEEGETPFVQLAEYVSGKRKIEDVANLVYFKDGKVQANPVIEPKKLNDLKPPSLEGLDLKQYFAPEIVMPFVASRGCYWRKCSFCDHDFGMHYNIKNLDKLVDEIKLFKEKYNITKFEFIDEAISPNYLKQMAQRFIDEDLNIQFFCDARLENEFSKEILELGAKAGLKMMLWGYESGSEKIMKLINKGIDIDKRLEIMKRANDAGIYNFAFIFFGFPAETVEDAMKTIDVICNNTDIIHSYGKSVFTMGKHTKLREAPEKYGVIGETKQMSEFSPTFVYNASGMTKEELNNVVNTCTKRANEAYGNSLSFHLLSREILFLYICKYGIKDLLEYKV